MKPEEISRPDKPLFPGGITKLDLARYDDRVAEVMVPHVDGRPLNLERYPDGIEGKQLFAQQAPPDRLEQLGGDPWADIDQQAKGLAPARKTLGIG